MPVCEKVMSDTEGNIINLVSQEVIPLDWMKRREEKQRRGEEEACWCCHCIFASCDKWSLALIKEKHEFVWGIRSPHSFETSWELTVELDDVIYSAVHPEKGDGEMHKAEKMMQKRV